jgi:nucleoside-diphosphate-sugar epimerase
MIKGRVSFAVAGLHPLLPLVRDFLIRQGLVLVPWGEDSDFCLVGAEIPGKAHPPLAELEVTAWAAKDTPVVLLSSNSVYPDCENPFPTRLAAREDDACLSILSWDHDYSRPLYALSAEHMFTTQRDCDHTLVIRPFDIFGPSITWGLIHNLLIAAKKRGPLCIGPHGFDYGTFLFEEDFLYCVWRLLGKFLSAEVNGVFNIGSSEEVSVRRAADSVWSFVHKDASPTSVANAPIERVLVPNIRKVKKAVSWKPQTTLRSGLFRMV